MTRAAFALAAALVVTPAVAQDEAVTLTYATYLPQSFTWVQVDDWFMQEVTARTDGRVRFETFYAASLLKALDVIPGLSAGAADLATGAPGYNVDMLPLSSVMQPYQTNKADAAVRAFVELYATEPALEQEWERNNMKLLYALAAVENTLWTDRPVTSREDLQGMRIRGTLGVAQSLELLGATTVAMGLQDAVDGLKRGVLDGMSSMPFDIGILAGLNNVAGYVNDAGNMGVYGIVTMAVNLDVWNDLPEDVQDTMHEVASEVPDKFIEITNKAVSDAVDAIIATEGLEVVLTTSEEDAAWKEATAQAVWDKWIADMNGRGLDGAAMMDAYVALLAKHEPNAQYRTGFDLWRERTGN
ncbi:MAG: TRAP transporter substrate-binding protein DctP [Pseudomonadota bacterium]